MGIGPFSSESTTRVDTRNTAFNTGFSEVGGAATSVNLDLGGRIKVGKGGQVAPVINLTDHGAIASSRDFADSTARAAFDFAENNAQESARNTLDLGRAAFNFADNAGSRQRDVFEGALDLTGRVAADQTRFARDLFGDSQDFARDTFGDALDLTGRVAAGQSSFARDLFGDALEATTGVLQEGQAQLGNVVTNLNAISRQQSTSSDERVQSIARMALIVAGGVAAIVGLSFALRGAR